MKSKAKSKVAKKRVRNELGYFVPVSDPTSGPLPKAKSSDAGGSDDLVSIKVRNPLHKIVQILQEIKSHQATSFNLHFSIPLIALPVFIIAFLGVFQLGRAQVTCFPTFTSKIGTLKTITVMAPKEQPNFLSGFSLLFPMFPKILPSNELTKTTRSLLIPSSLGEPLSIITSADLNLLNFQGQTVVVTGNFSQCTNSITLDNVENIATLK